MTRGDVDEGRRRVAQAFDFAGITNRMGALSFAFFAKGGYEASPPTPCKKHKNGAPSVGLV